MRRNKKETWEELVKRKEGKLDLLIDDQAIIDKVFDVCNEIKHNEKLLPQ